jgi:hypothetical protein
MKSISSTKITQENKIMAGLGFGSVKGSAKKDKADSYKIVDGDNSVRLFGNILPRYLYWIKGTNNKNLPFECLEFNRATETFDKGEKDYVKDFYPDLKCGWSYSMMCLDAQNKPMIFNFKKKLFDQIMANIADLGDPTDPDTGWLLKFNRRKTGPLAINVEYTLQTVKCLNSKGPLTEAEKAAIAEAKTIEELLPRATPTAQKELLEKLQKGETDNIDESVEDELDVK